MLVIFEKFIEIHETDNVEIGWHPHNIKNSKTKFENNDKFIIDEMDYIYNKIVGIRSNIKFSNGRDVYVK